MTHAGSEKPHTSRRHMSNPVHCNATTRSGRPCGNHPVRGATVCRMHGGRAPQVVAAANRRIALQAITAEGARLGRIIDITPNDAIIEMVRESAGNVAAIRLAVEGLGITVDHHDAVAVPASFDEKGKRDPALAHILVAMYNEERDRLVRYSTLAVAAGVDIKRVELAEAQARLVTEAVKAAVTAAGVTETARQAAYQAAADILRNDDHNT